MNIILLYFAIKYNGDWDKIYNALDAKEKVSLKEMNELEQKTQEWSKQGINFKSLLDADYPRQFKEAYKPPFIFWYKGNLDLLKSKGICLSSDTIEASDKDILQNILEEIKKSGNVLINANLTGGDLIINKSAQALEINEIQVMNCGIDSIKASSNQLIISEINGGLDRKIESTNSLSRLTATLSSDLILLSSNEKTHTNLVANFLNIGKEIHCFPKDANSKNYNNTLIQQGANLITSVQAIKNIDKDLELSR